MVSLEPASCNRFSFKRTTVEQREEAIRVRCARYFTVRVVIRGSDHTKAAHVAYLLPDTRGQRDIRSLNKKHVHGVSNKKPCFCLQNNLEHEYDII